MKTLLALATLLATLGAAHAAPKGKSPSYARLGSAALHGAAEAMLKHKELKEWFLDRKGTASKTRILKHLKIQDIDLSKGVYRAKVATKSLGQDGEPQIRSSVRIEKLSRTRYRILGARITGVNSIWE